MRYQAQLRWLTGQPGAGSAAAQKRHAPAGRCGSGVAPGRAAGRRRRRSNEPRNTDQCGHRRRHLRPGRDDPRDGPTVFLLLFVLLFLVGGGIGQVVFFIPAWAVATRIHQPLTWWRRVLPEGLCGGLAQLWPWLLAIAAAMILTALFVATFGYIPGVADMDRVMSINLSMVGSALICFLLAFGAGFAYDIEHAERRIGQLVGGTP